MSAFVKAQNEDLRAAKSILWYIDLSQTHRAVQVFILLSTRRKHNELPY